MKSLQFTTIFVLFCLVSYTVQGQVKTTDTNAAKLYYKSIMRTDDLYKKDEKRYAFATLNTFFENQINAVSSTSKISTTPFYASISNDDDLFSLGGNYTFKANDSSRVRFVMSGGLTANSAKSFAAFYKNGKPENEISAKLNFTFIGNGKIFFYKDQKQAYLAFHQNLETEFQSKVKKLLDPNSDLNVKSNRLNDISMRDTARLKLFQEEVDALILANINEEVKAMEKYDWYNWARDYYFGLDCKLPLSAKQYQFSDSANAANLRDKKFYAWQVGLTGALLLKHKSNTLIYVSGNFKAYNNNNIETEDLTSVTNNIVSSNTASQITVVDSKKFYQGSIKEFASYSVGGEATIFPGNKIIGFSIGGDVVFGSYQSVNWKMGVPISLKDSEGKPVVNFELQWKEVSSNHYLGVNVGFTIGKLMEKL